MSDVKLVTVSYSDSKHCVCPGDDSYGIYSYTQSDERINTFFSNPNLVDYDSPMVNLSMVDGVIVGRAMVFPTKIKIDDRICPCTTGSSLEVVSGYRHHDVGADIVLKPIRDKSNKHLIYADFSEDGINMYKAARFSIFRMPVLMQPRKIGFLLQMLGISGLLFKILSIVGNILLRPAIYIIDWGTKRKLSRYRIVETNKVPSWVDDITLNDGHRFREVHDHKWLQWTLDNQFHYSPVNKNRFFVIRNDDENLGFFMIKERTCTIEKRGIKDAIMTTVVEWGMVNHCPLDEVFVNRLASLLCNPDTDIVRVATDDVATIRKSKKYLFFPHGEHFIVYKDNTKEFKESKNQSLWRLRFGYSDSIFN